MMIILEREMVEEWRHFPCRQVRHLKCLQEAQAVQARAPWGSSECLTGEKPLGLEAHV